MVAFDRGPAQNPRWRDRRGGSGLRVRIRSPIRGRNGRIHRYLIHHVLAQRGFSPAGVVFPISAAILEWIDKYRAVLEDYSRRLLPVIEWQARSGRQCETC